ncbi:hypothetical protein V6N13_044945 [Hibiscus sabdariffa]|uniref:Uncharacterized protein n=1 Tax=Hibiscus sabdariffa TaxID=183260 RepID=A0ABR2RK23_9ROSI
MHSGTQLGATITKTKVSRLKREMRAAPAPAPCKQLHGSRIPALELSHPVPVRWNSSDARTHRYCITYPRLFSQFPW